MPARLDTIAVFNAGSSSLKFSIYHGESQLYQGLIDRLESTTSGTSRAVITGSSRDKLFDGPAPARSHDQALEWLLTWLRQRDDKLEPAAIGHRVVHGGDQFVVPTKVSAEVVTKLEALTPLAPLHQPHTLTPVRFFLNRFPELPQVVCFDTAFHASESRIERMYALPREYFANGIKRYGFHGLSYEFIAGQLAQVDPQAAKGRTIVCHLGNGASLCAMQLGKSVATTMGFTPLDGLPMGTRCGTISPDVLFFAMRQQNLGPEQLSDLLYHRSGLFGISGISADMRDLLASPETAAAEAVEYFCYRIAREIGSLSAALGGLDAIVFTAGIGEHAPKVRARVLELSHWLGVNFDAEANAGNRTVLHVPSTPVHVLVIPTNEELMICRHTRRLLAAGGNQAT